MFADHATHGLVGGLANVADTDATYEAVIEAPAGIEVTVEPHTFTVGAGDPAGHGHR